jgi:excisionase family DNA binding protein
VPELAARLRIGRRAAYEAVKRGDVPGAVRIGRTIRVSAYAVDQWIHGTGLNGTEEGGLIGTPPLADEQEDNPNGDRQG